VGTASTSVTAPVTGSGWLAATAILGVHQRDFDWRERRRQAPLQPLHDDVRPHPQELRRVDSSGIVNVSVYSVVQRVDVRAGNVAGPVVAGIANHGSWA
jgi:hypothetical protein